MSHADEGIELRHLRYLVAVADAGTFTRAAERMYIAQPTLSQQIRRLEELVGTPLLERRRDGVSVTAAGSVLLEEARAALARLEHGLRECRQAAGLDRPRLRFVLPPQLPEELAVDVAARLRSVAAAAGAVVRWLEVPLDAGFTLLRQRRADAGLGWLTSGTATLDNPLDGMTLGEFEPEVWLAGPPDGPGRPGDIGLDELAEMDVVHGPRRVSPATYDTWLAALRARRPGFEFIDPPSWHSLPVTLAFAATASRPTAVLTGPLNAAGNLRPLPPGSYQMARVRLDGRQLTATAAVAWNVDLPRHLQQVLFDTVDPSEFAFPHDRSKS